VRKGINDPVTVERDQKAQRDDFLLGGGGVGISSLEAGKKKEE